MDKRRGNPGKARPPRKKSGTSTFDIMPKGKHDAFDLGFAHLITLASEMLENAPSQKKAPVDKRVTAMRFLEKLAAGANEHAKSAVQASKAASAAAAAAAAAATAASAAIKVVAMQMHDIAEEKEKQGIVEASVDDPGIDAARSSDHLAIEHSSHSHISSGKVSSRSQNKRQEQATTKSRKMHHSVAKATKSKQPLAAPPQGATTAHMDVAAGRDGDTGEEGHHAGDASADFLPQNALPGIPPGGQADDLAAKASQAADVPRKGALPGVRPVKTKPKLAAGVRRDPRVGVRKAQVGASGNRTKASNAKKAKPSTTAETISSEIQSTAISAAPKDKSELPATASSQAVTESTSIAVVQKKVAENHVNFASSASDGHEFDGADRPKSKVSERPGTPAAGKFSAAAATKPPDKAGDRVKRTPGGIRGHPGKGGVSKIMNRRGEGRAVGRGAGGVRGRGRGQHGPASGRGKSRKNPSGRVPEIKVSGPHSKNTGSLAGSKSVLPKISEARFADPKLEALLANLKNDLEAESLWNGLDTQKEGVVTLGHFGEWAQSMYAWIRVPLALTLAYEHATAKNAENAGAQVEMKEFLYTLMYLALYSHACEKLQLDTPALAESIDLKTFNSYNEKLAIGLQHDTSKAEFSTLSVPGQTVTVKKYLQWVVNRVSDKSIDRNSVAAVRGAKQTLQKNLIRKKKAENTSKGKDDQHVPLKKHISEQSQSSTQSSVPDFNAEAFAKTEKDVISLITDRKALLQFWNSITGASSKPSPLVTIAKGILDRFPILSNTRAMQKSVGCVAPISRDSAVVDISPKQFPVFVAHMFFLNKVYQYLGIWKIETALDALVDKVAFSKALAGLGMAGPKSEMSAASLDKEYLLLEKAGPVTQDVFTLWYCRKCITEDVYNASDFLSAQTKGETANEGARTELTAVSQSEVIEVDATSPGRVALDDNVNAGNKAGKTQKKKKKKKW